MKRELNIEAYSSYLLLDNMIQAWTTRHGNSGKPSDVHDNLMLHVVSDEIWHQPDFVFKHFGFIAEDGTENIHESMIRFH